MSKAIETIDQEATKLLEAIEAFERLVKKLAPYCDAAYPAVQAYGLIDKAQAEAISWIKAVEAQD